MDANSLTQTWMGGRRRTVSTEVVQGEDIYLWFITEDDDVATRHHAVITKVFHKSFQAECDDGSVWKGVLIELMRGPNCPDGVWQRMQNVDTDTDNDSDSDSDSDPDELPAAVKPKSVEPAAVPSDSDSDSSSSEEEEEIVEVVVVGRKKKRRFR